MRDYKARVHGEPRCRDNRRFYCRSGKHYVCWCRGAADNMPDTCDCCWAQGVFEGPALKDVWEEE